MSVYDVDRGGEATYHGPGQLVAYPIVNIRPFGGPVKFVRTLEQVIISHSGRLWDRRFNQTGVHRCVGG